MSGERKPLPKELQSLTLGYINLGQPTSDEKFCHYPMMIYYDRETREEFDSECVLPGNYGFE